MKGKIHLLFQSYHYFFSANSQLSQIDITVRVFDLKKSTLFLWDILIIDGNSTVKMFTLYTSVLTYD